MTTTELIAANATRGSLFVELYRGYEIHADLAGYGYVAHLPNYDGEPCLHDWSVAGIKSEINDAVEDATAAARIAELQAAYDAAEDCDYYALGQLDCAKGRDMEQDIPGLGLTGGWDLFEWQRGFMAEQKRQDDLVVAEWKSKGRAA
jgi:hypothetical protein